MAFPVLSTAAALSGAGTSVTLTKPAGLATGDLIIVVLAIDAAPTVSWASSGGGAAWTEVPEVEDGTGAVTFAAAWKRANASDVSNANLGTATIGASEDFVGSVMRFTTLGVSATEDPQFATFQHGVAGTSSDPPNLDPPWGTDDTLWMVGFAADNQTATPTPTYPTNYTSNQVAVTSPGTAANRVAYARATRNLNADSENPGAFTLVASNESVAWTIAIPSTAAVSGPTVKSATDTLSTGITDAVGPFMRMFSASDALDPTVTEGYLLSASLAAADTLAVSLAEAQNSLLMSSVTDNLNVALDETSNLVVVAFVEALDTLSVGLTETGEVVDLVPVVKAATDIISVAIAEAQQSSSALSASDTLNLAVAEGRLLLVALGVADTIGVSFTEVASILSTVFTADTLDVAIADAASPSVLIAVADALNISLGEAAAVIASAVAVESLQAFLRDMAVASAELRDRRVDPAFVSVEGTEAETTTRPVPYTSVTDSASEVDA